MRYIMGFMLCHSNVVWKLSLSKKHENGSYNFVGYNDVGRSTHLQVIMKPGPFAPDTGNAYNDLVLRNLFY